MTVFRILPNGARRRLPGGSVRALGANGSRYFDVSGSTSLGVDAGGVALPVVPMVGQTWLSFALAGSLTQAGTVGRTTLSIGVAGALSSAVSLRGASLLGVNLLGNLTPSVRLYGNTGMQFAAAGRLLPSVPLRGLADLAVDVIGQLSVAAVMSGQVGLGIGVYGSLTAKAGKKWRDMWRDVYEARQALLNAIDANNRLLAKNADGKAQAAADAIVQTNVRVDEVEDGIVAEAQRLTVLTGRVGNVEGTQSAQGIAMQNLQTTQTSQGNTLTSHSQQLVSVQSSITTLDGKVTTNANATTALDARVSVNEQGVAQAKATWGVYLTAGNVISGVQSINNGIVAEFNVMAHVFRLLSPAGADGMEIRDGYIRVWRGSVQRIIGNGFGAGGQLMDYFGPNVGVAAASKSNAIMYMDILGNAYWGGALSAGIIKNSAQTTVLTMNPTIEVGPFTTNGRPKQVTAGYSANSPTYTDYYPGRPESNPPPPPTISQPTTYLTISRRIDGNPSWTQISSTPISHGSTVVNAVYIPRDALDPNLPNGGWKQDYYWSSSASVTYTDTQVGTANFSYAAAAGSPSYVKAGQVLSVLSTEE